VRPAAHQAAAAIRLQRHIVDGSSCDVVLNSGSNSNLSLSLMAPITGITLPFISFGGSSFISSCFLFFICL
jgi:cell division protein FtsW (lipid II flippase)